MVMGGGGGKGGGILICLYHARDRGYKRWASIEYICTVYIEYSIEAILGKLGARNGSKGLFLSVIIASSWGGGGAC